MTNIKLIVASAIASSVSIKNDIDETDPSVITDWLGKNNNHTQTKSANMMQCIHINEVEMTTLLVVLRPVKMREKFA